MVALDLVGGAVPERGVQPSPVVELFDGKRRTTGMKKGMKESYVEDLAKSRRPRVMRWRPVRAQRSVGRGARGPGVEPRNVLVWDADALIDAEGNIVGRGIASGRRVPRGQRARARVRSFHAENREILWPPVAVMAGRAAQGRLRPYA